MRLPILVTVLILCVSIFGCGNSAAENPAAPSIDNQTAPEVESQSNSTPRSLIGLWACRVSEDHTSIDLIPLRTTDWHLNALGFMENGPCTNCVSVEQVWEWSQNHMTVDIRLAHPMPGSNLNFSVFDVRGIFITPGSYEFSGSGEVVALGDDRPRMIDPDGYTRLFNPTDFPEDSSLPDYLKYFPGRFSTDGELTSTINPYLVFHKDGERRVFKPNWAVVRTYMLLVPDGAFDFGYAVDASWANPGMVVTDPKIDFPPEANSLEANQIDVRLSPGLVASEAGTVDIEVDVRDHQGSETVERVSVEAPDLFDGEIELDLLTANQYRSTFTGSISNDKIAGNGEYPLLVKVDDTETDQNLGEISAYFIEQVDLRDGWAYTIEDLPKDVTTDSEGNIYLGTDIGGVVGKSSFIKYSPDGVIQWKKTWQATFAYFGNGVWISDIAISEMDSLYVCGEFFSTVHIGGVELVAHGAKDSWLGKFNTSGDMEWILTWGDDTSARPAGVATDGNENVIVSGDTYGPVDLDPGDGEAWTVERGGYLIKFNPDGEYIWSVSWPGISPGEPADIAVGPADEIYTLHDFNGTYDFDPGVPVHEIITDESDIVVSELTSDGEFVNAIVVGTTGSQRARALDVDDAGNLAVAGLTYDTTDVDPGPGDYIVGIDESTYGFITALDTDENFLWGYHGVSGAPYGDCVINDAEFSPDGSVVATGTFTNGLDCDVDGTLEVTDAPGMFTISLDPSGTIDWCNTVYGFGDLNVTALCVDISGNPIITGTTSDQFDTIPDNFDFNPGPGLRYLEPGFPFIVKYPQDGEW